MNLPDAARRRVPTVRAAVIACALALGLCHHQGLGADGPARGPMLARLSPTEATIAWHTDASTRGAVRWGGAPDSPKRVPSAGNGTTHEVVLTGLDPGKTYHYKVEVDGKAGPSYAFTTPGKDPARTRIAVLGDSGSGSAAQLAVAKAIELAKPDLVVHTGDLVYPKGEDRDFVEQVWKPYKTLLATTPVYFVLGNHDAATDDGAPFLRNLCLPNDNPAGHERWYSVPVHGHRLLALDSTKFGADFEPSGQRAWVEKALAWERTGWTIAFFHHPLYGCIGDRHWPDLARRIQVLPVLEAARADLVVTGHDHYYHRTHPTSLTGPWTIVHAITGAGGKSLYEGTPRAWTAAYKSAWHYLWIDLESPATAVMEARIVDPDTGNVTAFDTVRLTRTPGGTRTW